MRNINKIMTVLVLVVAVFAFVAPVFANQIIDTNIPDYSGGGAIDSANKAVSKAWNTIRLILQIAAVAAVVFAGVRYMFASADQKADIKKSMGILAVGAALVFGATFIIDFIVNITEEIAS